MLPGETGSWYFLDAGSPQHSATLKQLSQNLCCSQLRQSGILQPWSFPTSTPRMPADTELIKEVFLQRRLKADDIKEQELTLLQTARFSPVCSWNVPQAQLHWGSHQWVPVKLWCLLALSQLMPDSELPRSKVQIQGLDHPGIGGTSWFETLLFLLITRFLPLSPSLQTGFPKDLLLPSCQALGVTYPARLLTWLQIGPDPTFPSFHQLRRPLGLLCLPPFLIHCSPEDNKHFRNRFRDPPQG